jgi:hypothetical protein
MQLFDFIDREAFKKCEHIFRGMQFGPDDDGQAMEEMVDAMVKHGADKDVAGQTVGMYLQFGSWVCRGPKMCVMPVEITEPLQSVPMRFSLDTYHQSYSQMLVVGKNTWPVFLSFPNEVYDDLSLDHTGEIASTPGDNRNTLVAITTTYGGKLLSYSDDPSKKMPIIYFNAGKGTIEDQLAAASNQAMSVSGNYMSKETQQAIRGALNFAMLVAHHPFTETWLNPGSAKQRAKFAAKAKGERKEREEQLLLMEPKVCRPQQDLPIWRQLAGTETGNSTHASPGFHWRRGYWGWRHYGPGKTKIKLVPVKEAMVNKHKMPKDGEQPTTIIHQEDQA